MLNDAVRNEAFATAIRKKACGARALWRHLEQGRGRM